MSTEGMMILSVDWCRTTMRCNAYRFASKESPSCWTICFWVGWLLIVAEYYDALLVHGSLVPEGPTGGPLYYTVSRRLPVSYVWTNHVVSDSRKTFEKVLLPDPLPIQPVS